MKALHTLILAGTFLLASQKSAAQMAEVALPVPKGQMEQLISLLEKRDFTLTPCARPVADTDLPVARHDFSESAVTFQKILNTAPEGTRLGFVERGQFFEVSAADLQAINDAYIEVAATFGIHNARAVFTDDQSTFLEVNSLPPHHYKDVYITGAALRTLDVRTFKNLFYHEVLHFFQTDAERANNADNQKFEIRADSTVYAHTGFDETLRTMKIMYAIEKDMLTDLCVQRPPYGREKYRKYEDRLQNITSFQPDDSETHPSMAVRALMIVLLHQHQSGKDPDQHYTRTRQTYGF